MKEVQGLCHKCIKPKQINPSDLICAECRDKPVIDETVDDLKRIISKESGDKIALRQAYKELKYIADHMAGLLRTEMSGDFHVDMYVKKYREEVRDLEDRYFCDYCDEIIINDPYGECRLCK